MNKEFEREEKRWLLVFTVLVLILTLMPYLVGYANQGEQWVYSGFVMGVEDGNSYLAKMLRGASGDWLFRTPYTAAEQQGIVAYLPYYLLGKLSAPPAQHSQLVVLYHLFRLGAGLFTIWMGYRLVALYLEDKSERRWAIIVITLGGGLGWILTLWGDNSWLEWIPLSFYSPESFGFLALLTVPHLALSRGLLIWGFVIMLSEEGWRAGIKIGFIWLMMGLVQPLNLIIAWAVTGAWFAGWLLSNHLCLDQRNGTSGIKSWQFIQSFLPAFGLSLPLLVYYLVNITSETLLSGWQSQSYVLSPGLLEYGFSYGGLLPFGLAYLIHKRMKLNRNEWLLASWVLILPLLISLPVKFQRRLADGAWLVIVLLAFLAVGMLPRVWRKRLKVLWMITLIPAFILFWAAMVGVGQTEKPVYRPAGEVRAFLFLKGQAENTDVVLSAYQTGNALPAWVPVYVVLGHPVETLNFAQTRRQVTALYNGQMRQDEREIYFRDLSVDFVIRGPEERSLGTWNPADDDCLENVFSEEGYEIYAVTCQN